jgi:hypothetical protein
MSKYTQQDTIDEKGSKILQTSLDESYFSVNPFNGKTPDIDGEIRLRDGRGRYLEKYLHYQQKSKKSIKNNKYFCKRSVIDYLVNSSVPTLLFVVDTTAQKTYWFFFDEKTKKSLKLHSDTKGRTLDLTGREIGDNSSELNGRWQQFAKSQSYRELSESLTDLARSFEENTVKCVGLLYLIRAIPKGKVAAIFSKILRVSEEEITVIIQKLLDKEIIISTPNLYLVENEQIGMESLLELISDTSPEHIDSFFDSKEEKARIREQLAKTEQATKFLQKESIGLLNFITKTPTNNDDICANLEILEQYAFRVPDQVIKISKALINAKPLPQKEYKSKLGKFKGKSNQDVILKVIDLLKEVRYHKPKEVLDLLTHLAEKEEYRKKAIEAIKSLVEYNLYALKYIGYLAQGTTLDELEKWSDSKKIKNQEVINIIAKELLNPEYEGHSMSDYKTFTISFGSLKPSELLQKIRGRTIEILKKLYTSSKDVQVRKEILLSLNEATRTPSRGNYSKELEDLVVNDTNKIIEFYLSIFPDSDAQLIKEIEEQAHWFVKRYGKDRLPKISELETRIASDKEYNMFKVFFGYDYKFDEELDWKKAKEQRENKINKFIQNINDETRKEWLNRIISIAKEYTDVDAGKFQYFNIFLHRLGKDKPEFAIELLTKHEKEMKFFLIHLLAGIWESSKKPLAKKLAIEWSKRGRHLFVLSYLFTYTDTLDLDLLNLIFKKVIGSKDKNAMFNILRVCMEKHSDSNQLKQIFILTLQELIKIKDDSWATRLWVRDYSLLETFKSQDYNTVLKSLILHSSVDYHVEEILKPIIKKYPQKVIGFFFERVTHHLKTQERYRYDAIPLDFHEIREDLAQSEKVVITEILKWFSEKDWLYHFEASNLLRAIFPSFNGKLETYLLDLIKQGGKRNALLVLSILRAYKGEPFLHEVSKAFIKKFLQNTGNKLYREYRSEMFIILSQTGVVTGEYGVKDAYKRKKDEIQPWKEDKNPTLQIFIKGYEKYLDDNIKFEEQRADENIQLMKKGIK